VPLKNQPAFRKCFQDAKLMVEYHQIRMCAWLDAASAFQLQDTRRISRKTEYGVLHSHATIRDEISQCGILR
jgi:hypothetical protein